MASLLLAASVLTAFAAGAPPELVGEWVTDERANPTVLYRITADGRFEHSSTSVTVSATCDTRVQASTEGLVVVEGALLRLEEKSSRFRSVNNCRPRWDYEKTGQLGHISLLWRLERVGPSTILVLRHRTGREERYYRR